MAIRHARLLLLSTILKPGGIRATYCLDQTYPGVAENKGFFEEGLQRSRLVAVIEEDTRLTEILTVSLE